MKIQKIDITPEKILDLLRDNFIFIIIVGIITFLFDYKDVFKGPDEFYYNLFFGLALLLSLIIFKKHRNPFYYSPSYIFFVKDRNDPIVKLEPLLDPLLTKLGLVRYDDFVNIRYRLYPDLPTGLELNPNTGLISGFPMEVGNHTSEVKMRFLGGEYSTNIRIEVVNTLKEKMVVPERGEFAPPRTVAQLLLREEDVLKREQDLDYSLSQEREIFEKEYNLKELSLRSKFDSEKSKLSKELADAKSAYDGHLALKNSEFTSLSSDMKENFVKLDQEKDSKIEELTQERVNLIEKVEAEMVTALQEKEREFIEFKKEYNIKELSLRSDFDSEKSKLSKELDDAKSAHEGQLTLKNSEFTTQSLDMKENFVKLDQEKDSKIEELTQEGINQIEKSKAEMVTVLQEKEREFIDFEKEIKSKFEAKERELEENYKVKKVVEKAPAEEELEEELIEEELEEVVEEEPAEEELEEEPAEEELEEELIEEEIEEELEEMDHSLMTVSQLKKLLKEKGLSTSGKKAKLISRLHD